MLSLFDQFAGLPAQMAWLPYIIGGIIGAIILFFVFDRALGLEDPALISPQRGLMN